MIALPTESEMEVVRKALASCCSETRRLLPDDVLAVPAVQHMLLTFLKDKSRSFEDWVLDPQCRHNLSKLRDRISSADGLAVTANYAEQCSLAAHERLRAGGSRSVDCGGWKRDGGDDGGGGWGAVAAASASVASVGGVHAGTSTAGGSVGQAMDEGGSSGGGGGGGNSSGGDHEQGGAEAAVEEAVAQQRGATASSTTSSTAAAAASRVDSGVAPAASPWMPSSGPTDPVAPPMPTQLPLPPPPQEIAQGVLPVRECGGDACASSAGGQSECEEEEGEKGVEAEVEGEDTYDMLMVMSEAIKEEAKGRFQRGDYMGAAKAYRRAAAALDERPPPSGARLEPLRRRLRGLYVTCMCNAAVSGFKAAKGSPSPGQAHGLVVDACSDALARAGGKCPKARFWRARVKLCQDMYEAAEADLRKAVEEEEEEGKQKREIGGEKEDEDGQNGADKVGQESGETPPASRSPQGGGAKPSGGAAGSVAADPKPPSGTLTPIGTSLDPSGTSAGTPSPSNGTCASASGAPAEAAAATVAAAAAVPVMQGTTSAPDHSECPPDPNDGLESRNGTSATPNGISATLYGTSAGPNGTLATSVSSGDTGSGGGGGGGGGAKKEKRASEAARWLARVRAKIEAIEAGRALAAAQAAAREESAAASQQRDLELAQRRARYGPGHVPRGDRPAPRRSVEGDGTGERQERGDADAQHGSSEGGKGSAGKGEVGAEDVVPGWKVPRPPPLKVEGRSPAMVLNNYSMQAKFQAIPQFEQVSTEDGRPEYLCTYSVGPEDRVVGGGRGTNMKAAKQQAARDLLKNSALAWNEENPEDLIDLDVMEPLLSAASASWLKATPPEVTEEFRAYCKAWIDKVVAEEIHEACFPEAIEKRQRKYVHSAVEELQDPAVLSKSATVKGRRRLSVMRRSMMEGLAFMSGDTVVVVDVPPPPTRPEDVGDMASIMRPPPERETATTQSATGSATGVGTTVGETADQGVNNGGSTTAPAVGEGINLSAVVG